MHNFWLFQPSEIFTTNAIATGTSGEIAELRESLKYHPPQIVQNDEELIDALEVCFVQQLIDWLTAIP